MRKAASFLAVCALFLWVGEAHAQSMSAKGMATGDNVVTASVPQAARVFDLLDELQALQQAVTDCAEQGALPDGSGGCRGSEAPDVEFLGDTVRVERPYPDHGSFAEYTGLDGDDGIWNDVTP